MNAAFSWPTRVYWEDTDAGGVVYHAQYVAFLERARSEWLRAQGHGQQQLRDAHDLVFAVRSMQLEFLRPARLDDQLQVSVEIEECRRASVVFAQSVSRGDQTLLTARVRLAALSAVSFRPRPVPDALFEKMQSLLAQPSPTHHPESRNKG